MDPIPLPSRRSRRTPLRLREFPSAALIELLVVTMATGILAVITIPMIDAPYRVDSGVQALATTLYVAQREAMARRYDIAVSFDPAHRRALLLDDVNRNGIADAGERVRTIPLDDGVVFGRGIAPARPMGAAAINFSRAVGGLPAVIFHRDGSASSAGGLYLTSARAQATAAYASDTRAIEIVRTTGRAEWWRYTGQGWIKGD